MIQGWFLIFFPCFKECIGVLMKEMAVSSEDILGSGCSVV